MKAGKNKQYWDSLGIGYSKAWIGKAKEFMSFREMSFINAFLLGKNPKNVLDIGIGNGRVLANHLRNVKNGAIYGIDISSKMVNICKKRFFHSPAIVKLAVCDFSKEKAPFKTTFDFVSSVRVIKYNENWPQMIGKIAQILNKGGIAVFDMPNKYSLNILGFCGIPFFRSSKKQLEHICRKNNLKILEMQSFTRIPDVFYALSDNETYGRCIIMLEKFFSKIFGKTFMGRILFLAVKKK